MRIVVAKDNHQLIEWGKYMSNCIASYANRTGTSLIALYRGEEMLYNIEIVNGEIRQMRARFNNMPDPKDQKTFTTYFEKFMEQLDTTKTPVV